MRSWIRPRRPPRATRCANFPEVSGSRSAPTPWWWDSHGALNVTEKRPFNEDAILSQPTTFAGGTLDTGYGYGGGVIAPLAPFSSNELRSGIFVNSFQLTFTNAVSSVDLDAEAAGVTDTTNLTLTAYDASNAVVGSATQTAAAFSVHTLSVSSSSDNIKYITIATDDPARQGVIFTNIVWACT